MTTSYPVKIFAVLCGVASGLGYELVSPGVGLGVFFVVLVVLGENEFTQELIE